MLPQTQTPTNLPAVQPPTLSALPSTSPLDLPILPHGGIPAPQGTPEWGEQVRYAARSIANNIQQQYLRLGAYLYAIDMTPLNSDPNQGPIYGMWGYQSIYDFAESELGISKRKADMVYRIYELLNFHLRALPPDLRARLERIDFAKLRETYRLISEANAEHFIQLCENNNYTVVQKEATRFREKLRREAANINRRITDSPALTTPSEQAEITTVTTTTKTTHTTQTVTTTSQPPNQTNKKFKNQPLHTVVGQVPPDPYTPPEQPPIPLSFRLYPEQNQTVEAALTLASEQTGSDKTGALLEWVCADFLAGQQGGTQKHLARQQMLARVERLTGLSLVAFDFQRAGLDVTYGQKNLEKAIQRSQSARLQPPAGPLRYTPDGEVIDQAPDPSTDHDISQDINQDIEDEIDEF